MKFADFWWIFPLFFPVMWVFVCFIISLTGWHTLARHFRAVSKPNGQNFYFQGGNIGAAQYSGCLNFTIAENGLYLRPILPFRAFHPALLVPWKAFETPKIEKVWWVNQFSVKVKTPDKQRVQLVLAPSVGALIAERIEAAKLAPETSPWDDQNALD